MKRREFLKLLSLATAGTSLPVSLLHAAENNRQQRILVLVELKGGNDGFNTLVPYADSLYYEHRPRIAIQQRQVLTLNEQLGLHPQLKSLMPYWNKGQLAWVQGVGYPNPVLSHFRSMDIWNAASNANQYIEEGWLSRVLPRYKQGLHGIALDKGQAKLGPLESHLLTAVTMQDPTTFLSQIKRISNTQPIHSNPAIAHVSQTQHELFRIGQQLEQKIKSGRRRTSGFSKGVLGHSLQAVAEMIINGVDSPVYKVTQHGFDTHSSQRGAQDNALYQVGHGLASFAHAMQQAGRWNDVLVVTYSEFGRRIVENSAAGTDHGTASSHLVMGGRVKGGIYGKHPDLSRLDANGNVQFTTDFRKIYATLASRWFRQPGGLQQYGVLPFV